MIQQGPTPQRPDETVLLIQLLRMCFQILISKWKWFVFSIVCCLVVGYVYLQKQPRVYLRQAVMLIEDAEPNALGGGSSRASRGNMSTLLELNGISVGDNLKNEIFIITSYRLMERVVDSLGLDIEYTMPQSLHTISLYEYRPFEVDFAVEKTDKPISFAIKTIDGKNFEMSDFHVGIEDFDTKISAKAGQLVKTPAGELTIIAHPGEILDSYLESPQTVTVSYLPIETAAAIYHAKVSAAEYDKESSLIVLSCNDINAKRAEDLLAEMFESYKRDVVENKNRVGQSTARFIDSRISLIGNELSSIETDLAIFKQDNQIIDFKQSAQVYMSETSGAHQRTLQLETQLAIAEYLLGFVKDHSHDKEIIPALALEGGNFSQPIAEYNKKMLERGRLIENSSETSTSVVELDRELSALRISIIASVESYMKSVALQVSDAKANEALIAGKMRNVPQKEKQALSIERQQMLKANLYNYLLNKREEVALQLAINEANVRLVEAPMGNPKPVSPRSLVIMVASVFLGVFIPLMVIWIIWLFDTTVSNRKDVEDRTSIPLAGELPRWENAPAGQLITSCTSDAPIIEAFRLLRYGLSFIQRNAKVIVATSATPGQGKSFVSRNLACVLAMTNKKVLLIDADIRKRTLTKSYGSSKGLTGFLVSDQDEVCLEELVLADNVCERVDFLPAGVLPPNPSELLMSKRLELLVEAAKEKYDYIIFDTTPMLSVADAGIVARVAEITLFVVRVGAQDKNFLPELDKMYQSKRFQRLCIVLNDSDVKGKGNGYGYGYGYGCSGTKRENPKRSKLSRIFKKNEEN